MGAGGSDPHAQQFAHQLGAALFFNGKGDFFHGEDSVQALHLFDVGFTDECRVLSTGAFVEACQ